MEERKIEAWTGPSDAEDSTMIGALVQAADGSIKQIDDRLKTALGGLEIFGTRDLAVNLIKWLKDGGYPNARLEFPWEEGHQNV